MKATIRKARKQYIDKDTVIEPGDLYIEFKYFKSDMFYDWARFLSGSPYGPPAITRVAESNCQLDSQASEMFREIPEEALDFSLEIIYTDSIGGQENLSNSRSLT